MARVVRNPKSKYWQVRWIDFNGKERQRSSKTTDKRTAEKLARKLEDDAAKVRTGLVSRREANILDAAESTPRDHLDDYLAWCRDRKRQAKSWTDTKRS